MILNSRSGKQQQKFTDKEQKKGEWEYDGHVMY